MDQRLIKHPLGFWEIALKPSADELRRYYAEKYHQRASGIKRSPEEQLFLRTKLEQHYAVIKRYTPNKGRTMLDVGCGEGFTLAFFRECGWTVKCFDFSAAGLESHNPHCRDALEVGDVFDLLKTEVNTGRTYDLVVLQNVLEHVIDPLGLLECLKAVVAPSGIVVVTVPNDCSITQQAALRYEHIDSAFWVQCPDHLNYFDHHALVSTVVETGWECLEALGDFPIDWFIRKHFTTQQMPAVALDLRTLNLLYSVDSKSKRLFEKL